MLVGRQCAFHSGNDLFDDIVARLGSERHMIAITLNYDLLFEEALERATRAFFYPRLTEKEETTAVPSGLGEVIPVYKLHGSINWFSARSFSGSADLEIARQNSHPVKLVNAGSMIASQTYATYVPPGRLNAFYEWENGVVTSGPVAAIYGTGKLLLENPEHVQAHRNDCFDRLSRIDHADVIAIGMRPVSVEDDPTTNALIDRLSRLDGKKTYISPSVVDCKGFAALGFEVRQVGLETWIEELPNPALNLTGLRPAG
jgi:hypothetical protein